ncbi:hypothetical protein B5C34_01130 [Pacificimonas flava]|uniref:Excinuclease ABC subunit A n=1 Tax=Pacificimonas flava TaxID=1234595 RepID=A0A219B1J0_9SPHN|nr:hypothetical protein B5C34_01130 [Pacificimonas flava]
MPPGLAKKGGLPPGQAKKIYGVGERLPTSFDYRIVEPSLYDRYDLRERDGYVYGYSDGRAYLIDPETRLVADVVRVLID